MNYWLHPEAQQDLREAALKAELLHWREIASEGELIAVLAGYIDRFYNVRRLHSSLGYHSPVEFEQLVSP